MLALVPLLPVALLLASQVDNPIPAIKSWVTSEPSTPPPVGVQLVAYVTLAVWGYAATDRLVPNIKAYTLRKGIAGKDLGKQGTAYADKLV